MAQTLQETRELEEAGRTAPLKETNGSVDWQKRCVELIAERDKMRKEFVELKEERDSYLRAVNALLPEPEYTYTKEEIMSQVGRLPPLEDFIAELERQIED